MNGPAKIDDGDDLDPDEFLAPQLSDEAMAIQFAVTYRAELRYVDAWGKWFIWCENVWKKDEKLSHYDFARKIVRRIANQLAGNASANLTAAQINSEAKRIASSSTVNAIIRSARADRRIAATVAQWDMDPWLLNTPDGVIDLKTGKLREHRPDDYMTKITSVSPGGDCPMWLAFLHKVMNGDQDLIGYLRRVTGYMLTGETKEHALFFLHGKGGNGKGVFIGVIAGILADYHRATPITTFTESKHSEHPTELARLHGARAVTAPETERGRKWAEAKVKGLTGGDPIAARFMRLDYFEFIPQFKLMISGQHKPGLRSVDDAMRRRFNLIPFAVRITNAEKDVDLAAKLVAEWPGILQWMIEGCLEWQRDGLKPPKKVTEATDEYLEGEDTLAAWIDECCIADKTSEEASGGLWLSWSTWADFNKEFVGTQTAFSTALKDRGFELKRRRFKGLRLNPDYKQAM